MHQRRNVFIVKFLSRFFVLLSKSQKRKACTVLVVYLICYTTKKVLLSYIPIAYSKHFILGKKKHHEMEEAKIQINILVSNQ